MASIRHCYGHIQYFWGDIVSDLGVCMARVYIIYLSQNGGAHVSFKFTKLLFALSSFAQPFSQMISI